MSRKYSIFYFLILFIFLSCSNNRKVKNISWEIEKKVKIKRDSSLKSSPTSKFEENFVIVDKNKNSLLLINRNGEIIDEFGEKSNAPTGFQDITGFSINSKGEIIVLDRESSKMTLLQIKEQKFNFIQSKKIVISGYSITPYISESDTIYLSVLLIKSNKEMYLLQKYNKNLELLGNYFEEKYDPDKGEEFYAKSSIILGNKEKFFIYFRRLNKTKIYNLNNWEFITEITHFKENKEAVVQFDPLSSKLLALTCVYANDNFYSVLLRNENTKNNIMEIYNTDGDLKAKSIFKNALYNGILYIDNELKELVMLNQIDNSIYFYKKK